MITRAKKVLVTLFASAMLVGGVAAPATAQVQIQDGLVNVAIGDITVEDVNVGIAALVAATICDVDIGPVVILGVVIDNRGGNKTICETEAGDVVLTQN